MANQTPKFKVGDRVKHKTEKWANAGTILIVRADRACPMYVLQWDCTQGTNTDPEYDLVLLSKLHQVLG